MRCKTIVVAVFALMMFPAAKADTLYWVSLSSHKQRPGAEQARQQAADQITESLAVMGADTPRGFFHRVVAGPYLTRSLAEERAGAARVQGFPGAWVWAEEDDVLGGEYDAAGEVPGINFPEYGSPAYEPDPDNGNLLLDNNHSVPRLADEAPPGYSLNRMRRDS